MVALANSVSEMVALRAAIHDRMADLTRALLGEPNRHLSTRREYRFGKRGSLAVVVAGPKVGTWYDHEAGNGGDVFDLISYRLGSNFRHSKEWAVTFVGSNAAAPSNESKSVSLAAASDNVEAARRIWMSAGDPRGSVVEAYLARRRLVIPDEIANAVIRYHGALFHNGRRAPGMVALMRDLRSNEPCAVHRTFLSIEGIKLEKKMLGRAKDAAIKLTADEVVTSGLHVGEGIETCLSWMELGYSPTWSLGSWGAIGRLRVFPGIDVLTIFKETDAASNEAALSCGTRWQEAGREVWQVTPRIPGDGNDVLRLVS